MLDEMMSHILVASSFTSDLLTQRAFYLVVHAPAARRLLEVNIRNEQKRHAQYHLIRNYSLCDSNDLPLCEAYWREDFDTLSPESLSMPLSAATAEQSAATSQSSTPSHPHVNGHGAGPTDHS
ncbi:hypothetical protein ASZ78_009542 [Callipepla squamata]|uniref:Uncharacterized protein n=1 Tax=Callipepla squamata TaxID=9009 RepID=A0A226NMM5_CALSU|nr:hypothetical protein ASZ78_009542 [Callipepla squamata]